MLGSADSISCTNVMMNTIVAQVLSEFADELEKADDFKSALKKLLVKTIKEHKRVIFNGNGYSDEWIDEAINRGLPNLVSTVDALPHYTDEKYVSMFEKFKVYSKTEIESRKEILLENYSKVINRMASTTFAILLIHDSNYSRNLIWNYILRSPIGQHLWRSQIEFIFTYFIIVIGLSGFCCLIDLIRQNTIDKLVMNSHVFTTLCEKTNMNGNAE